MTMHWKRFKALSFGLLAVLAAGSLSDRAHAQLDPTGIRLGSADEQEQMEEAINRVRLLVQDCESQGILLDGFGDALDAITWVSGHFRLFPATPEAVGGEGSTGRTFPEKGTIGDSDTVQTSEVGVGNELTIINQELLQDPAPMPEGLRPGMVNPDLDVTLLHEGYRLLQEKPHPKTNEAQPGENPALPPIRERLEAFRLGRDVWEYDLFYWLCWVAINGDVAPGNDKRDEAQRILDDLNREIEGLEIAESNLSGQSGGN